MEKFRKDLHRLLTREAQVTFDKQRYKSLMLPVRRNKRFRRGLRKTGEDIETNYFLGKPQQRGLLDQDLKWVKINTYILEDEGELKEIGVEDYLGDENTVCVVEWPDKIEGLLQDKKVIKIMIKHAEDNGRRIKIEE